MPSEPTDWPSISGALNRLHKERTDADSKAAAEIDLLEQAIGNVNPQLDGFAFKLNEEFSHDDPLAIISVKLRDIRAELDYRSYLQVEYFYSGRCTSYLVVEGVPPNGPMQKSNRVEQITGLRSVMEWQTELANLANAIMRHTPRPILRA